MRRLLLALAFIVTLLSAQELRSTLAGRVTDPAGAAIPNVKIQVRNIETGASLNTATGFGPRATTATLRSSAKYCSSG